MRQYANVGNDIQNTLYDLAGNNKKITLGASFTINVRYMKLCYSNNRHIIIKSLNHCCVILYCHIITILI